MRKKLPLLYLLLGLTIFTSYSFIELVLQTRGWTPTVIYRAGLLLVASLLFIGITVKVFRQYRH
ncbi:hypothetical protein [Lactiplantibacillus fabifermentans]|uniref:Uncharacterized protein n=2 Tax=Lactiplantibacillus fabifermentans TaxID=483011 RepID=A0A0R2NNN2_9LACO|nr:hypothetical protein [Lactiplantibacillus fabifermentans]ETY72771.1 hypothetical protein LFAB_15985 [Lactiplantibacillus fabifermentans T30PCM01]KRO24746.1 hypothetical protein DY78_GL001596 [Lactiplantibacillus fabifermentans DSM 21115]